jgi:hypothetical protein
VIKLKRPSLEVEVLRPKFLLLLVDVVRSLWNEMALLNLPAKARSKYFGSTLSEGDRSSCASPVAKLCWGRKNPVVVKGCSSLCTSGERTERPCFQGSATPFFLTTLNWTRRSNEGGSTLCSGERSWLWERCCFKVSSAMLASFSGALLTLSCTFCAL